MRKENEFGGEYYQVNFTHDELESIRHELIMAYDPEKLDDYDYMLLNIIDRIEKELGIE